MNVPPSISSPPPSDDCGAAAVPTTGTDKTAIADITAASPRLRDEITRGPPWLPRCRPSAVPHDEQVRRVAGLHAVAQMPATR